MRFTTIIASFLLVILWGCSPTIRTSSSDRSPGAATYDYFAVNDNCNCEEFTTTVPGKEIKYTFRANYSVETTIITYIEIQFHNNSRRVMELDPGVVKITSKNISYEYNDKFLPLPKITIHPHSKEQILLTGKDIRTSPNEWNKIAGEQLQIILKGMRLGEEDLPQQEVTFVPVNPQIKK
ncbi:MAG: hypothetical protein ACHQQQ_03440 [Bacteroidota bacterium]